jgi:hypothetical protein
VWVVRLPLTCESDSGLTPTATVEAAAELQRPESTTRAFGDPGSRRAGGTGHVSGQANTVSQSSAMLTTVHPSRTATSLIGSDSWNVSAVLT